MNKVIKNLGGGQCIKQLIDMLKIQIEMLYNM